MTPVGLYEELLKAWNDGDAERFAQVFANPCSCVGFDGTEYTTPSEVRDALRTIFSDHEVASYVWSVRAATDLREGVVLVRAVAGMVSPDNGELMPDRHCVQNTVVVETPHGWRIASYQNTPARYDGSPETLEALTSELDAARNSTQSTG
jgi:uncharacterized protein (TIGR02246 family)